MEFSSRSRSRGSFGALSSPHAYRIESLRGCGETSGSAERPSAGSLSDPSAQWVLAGSISGLCLLSGHIATVIGSLVGLAYPAYLSIKALEAADSGPEAENASEPQGKHPRDEKRELLTYWVCYALLQMAEGIMGPWIHQVLHPLNCQCLYMCMIACMHAHLWGLDCRLPQCTG